MIIIRKTINNFGKADLTKSEQFDNLYLLINELFQSLTLICKHFLFPFV
jgi:hypothetical protein